MKTFIIKHNIPGIAFNQLVKRDLSGNVDWIMEPEKWGFIWGEDRYFSEEEIDTLPDDWKEFIKSEFCEVIEV